MSDKKKKFTIKDAEERLNILAYNINAMRSMIDNLGFAMNKYIDFKGDLDNFKKSLENKENLDKLKENAENNAK